MAPVDVMGVVATEVRAMLETMAEVVVKMDVVALVAMEEVATVDVMAVVASEVEATRQTGNFLGATKNSEDVKNSCAQDCAKVRMVHILQDRVQYIV